MKAGSIGKDIMQVIGIGLLLTLLLTIVSIGISLAINNGKPGAVDIALIIPTSPPPTATPTEIPCTAQEWWTAHSAAAGDIFSNARKTTLATKVPDIQKADLALKQWQITFEADATPPCANAAKTAVVNAANTAHDLYGFYTKTTTEQQRAQQTIQLADKLLAVYDELDKLKINVTDTWLVEAKDYSRADCPIERWYTEQFIGKGYNSFIRTNPKLDITKMTPAQMTDLLKQYRTLQSSLNTDKGAFPQCVLQATDYLMNYFKAGGDALNSSLNNDLVSVQGYLTAMPTALNGFYATIKKLDPNLVTT
jgi:primosomal protein N''